jgi:hypothetical protein
MKSNPYYYIEREIALAKREGDLQLAEGLARLLERKKGKTRAQRRALAREIENLPQDSPLRGLLTGKRKKSSTPTTRSAISALGLRLRPAPISFSAGDCSQTTISAPRRSSASAVASPYGRTCNRREDHTAVRPDCDRAPAVRMIRGC